MIAQQHPRVYKRGGKENILISTQQNQTLTSAFCYFQQSVVSRSLSVLQNVEIFTFMASQYCVISGLESRWFQTHKNERHAGIKSLQFLLT